jgi:hypothetical protein
MNHSARILPGGDLRTKNGLADIVCEQTKRCAIQTKLASFDSGLDRAVVITNPTTEIVAAGYARSSPRADFALVRYQSHC